MKVGTPKEIAQWVIWNILLIQGWLLIASLLVAALLLDGPPAGDRLNSFVQGYLDFTVLSGVGYVPYLAILFFLPRTWSPLRKRVAAVLLSPLIALFMILPFFILFALMCGLTVVLPLRGIDSGECM